MRPHLRYLLLDDFDPDTGDLSLRVAMHPGADLGPEMLRMRLHLGRAGDPLEVLRRELRTHVHMPVPGLWEQGLKTIIHALEEELEGPDGRNPLRYLWVRTQVLHSAEPARSTPNHHVQRQVEILREWAQRMEQEEELVRASEFWERLLLLSPRDAGALKSLSSFFRGQGMVEEMLQVTERWLAQEPGDLEAKLRQGEGFLHQGRASEARGLFEGVLRKHPLHLLAHLGMAQALGFLGGNLFPHLDAALELDPEATRAVLRETFDYRILTPPAGDRCYALQPRDELAQVLGVSSAEVRQFVTEGALPATGPGGAVRESELARWVGIMNRYHMLPGGLHWSAPTPRRLPDLDA